MTARRIRRVRLMPLLVLTVVWVMLWGNVSGINVVSGLVVGAVVQWVFPMPGLTTRLRLSPVGLLVLGSRFLADLVVASFAVAALALRPRPISAGSVIDLRLHLPDDLRRTIVAELTSLVPGTVVIDLDQATGVLTLHVLDETDPAALERETEKIRELEQRVARAFPLDVADAEASTGAPRSTTAQATGASRTGERRTP